MQDIGSIVYFVAFYFVLMVLIPAGLLKLPLGRKHAADSMVKAMLVSYTVCISWVYALGLLHIYNKFTLIISLILTVIIYGYIKKVDYRKAVMNIVHVLALLGGGQYRVEVFARDWMRKGWKGLKESIIRFFKELTFSKVIYVLVGLAAFLILMQRRLTPFFGSYAYMTSDMYVHNEWINFMEAGDIFYDGIYPFGMHNILSAFHLLTGLKMNQIFRYYGAVNCFLVAAMAVYFLRRVGRTKAAVLIYLVLYGVTNFTGNGYAYRMGFTLPQECGMPFLLVSMLFLGKFLEGKKKEDGIYFALSASLIVSFHFFTAIFAIILCGGLGLTYLRKIWKEKLLLPLLKCLLLIICICCLPFLVGKLEGKYWQGSMGWALSVMQTENQEEEQEENEGEELTAEAQAQEEAAAQEEAEKKSVKEIFYQLFRLFASDSYSALEAFWGYVFWAGMLIDVLYFLIGIKKWEDWRCRQLFAVWLMLLVCVILIGYWILGIPRLMKEERVRMFIGYLGPMLCAIPLEALAVYFGKWGRRISEPAGILLAGTCFYATYGLGNIPTQSYFYLETSTAAQACVEISKEYENNTWTVVSPVEELYFIRGQGYHYELWEFITAMERYEAGSYLAIPTKYVFFILEKNPIPYNETRYFGEEYEDAPVDLADARQVSTAEMLGITEKSSMKFYNIYENRRVLEAKLKAWIEAYQKMFPDQMSVYMESEDCIIYCLEQNIFALNNLAIDYGYNVISDEEYESLLAAKQKELKGQEVEE